MAFKYYSLITGNGNDKHRSRDEFLQELGEVSGETFTEVSLEELFKQDVPIIYIKSGGIEEKFLKFYENLKSPILLLTSGQNNSLSAALEILSFLKIQGIKGEILHGSLPYISSRLLSYIKINETNKALKGARLGIIGKPSDWLIASQVNYQKIKSKTGIELVDIEVSELVEKSKSCSRPDPVKRNQLLEKGFPEKEVTETLKVYEALKEISKKYSLNGLTIRCFDLISALKTTSCIAVSFLNDEGIISGCEGDIPSLISMFILNRLTGEKVFMSSPTSINLEENSVILSNCTVPTSMCTSYTLSTHYQAGIGIVIKGEIPAGRGTIFKLSNNLDEYFVSSMNIEESLKDSSLCRTQIKAVLKEDVKYFLKAPLGNHHLVIEGDHTKIIDSFFNQK